MPLPEYIKNKIRNLCKGAPDEAIIVLGADALVIIGVDEELPIALVLYAMIAAVTISSCRHRSLKDAKRIIEAHGSDRDAADRAPNRFKH